MFGNSDAEHSERCSSRDFFLTKTSACSGQPLLTPHNIQNDRESPELILQQNHSVWSTQTVTLSQLLKKWGLVQFDGAPFEHKEDGKLTARLQVYGRVICPDAAVLVTAFSFRNRKQGSHLMTTEDVFSWQVFLNLQFNKFSSLNITDEEGQSPTLYWRHVSVIFGILKFQGKWKKMVQVLTLLLLYLPSSYKNQTHKRLLPLVYSRKKGLQCSPDTHYWGRDRHKNFAVHPPPINSSAFNRQHCSEPELAVTIVCWLVWFSFSCDKAKGRQQIRW